MTVTTSPNPLKVAAVARRAGVSVRTLHYYEEIGLLKPSDRTPSGHRLYTASDLERLQQIRSLQQLGMSLAEITDSLSRGKTDSLKIVSQHLARTRAARADLMRLEERLEQLERQLGSGEHGDARTTEALMRALETITMLDKYFTQDQLSRLQDHQAVGEETVTPSIQALQSALDNGVLANSDEANTLLARFKESVEAVAKGDEAMAQSILHMLHSEEEARKSHGISEPLFAFMGSIDGGSDHGAGHG